MILKRENNFLDRVNDAFSKGKKVPMLTTMKFDSKMARKRKCISFNFNTTYVGDSSNMSVAYRFVQKDRKKQRFFT